MQITHKRSNVAEKVPQTTDLALGELAINTHDGKLFLKKNNGVETIVELGSSSEASSLFREASPTLEASYALSAGINALAIGPLTIADGATLTLPSDTTLSII